METSTAALRSFSFDLASELVARLYDQLRESPIPLCTGKRMKLPCVIFQLGSLSVSGQIRSGISGTDDTPGIVEITHRKDLSRSKSLSRSSVGRLSRSTTRGGCG